MVPLSFARHEFLACGQAALFWPARRALLVADLHLEKASWYAQRGQPLPPYDSRATLSAVAALIDRTEARALWCLGDSFHDSAGATRMDAAVAAQLRALTGRVDWHWVTGNHDPRLEADLLPEVGGHVVRESVVEGIVLRHEAVRDEDRPEISGHFHPKLRMSLRGHHVSRRCFVRTDRKLLMPAFGSLTGGLDATSATIKDAVGGYGGDVLVPVEQRLLRFPLDIHAAS
jgi:DNA ligase-associated metallophosphoesterase